MNELPPLREVIEKSGLQPDKKLGQNFLLDQNITDKIVRHGNNLTDQTVIEIGPGPGGLTRSILQSGIKKLYAIEYDPRAVKALQPLIDHSDGRLEVIHADALQMDITTMTDGASFHIYGNLPYNIATPLLLGWLEKITNNVPISSMVLMFQKEVADRILAVPSTKTYGRLSVMSQWICECSRLFDLPPTVFTPPPKIDSSVVHFKPKASSTDDQNTPTFKHTEKLIKAAFAQRRKMLRSTLKNYAAYFEAAEIDPQARAEQISVENFIKLAELSS